jgi:hypothetical protein
MGQYWDRNGHVAQVGYGGRGYLSVVSSFSDACLRQGTLDPKGFGDAK